jgi:hypothetical protein
VVKGILVDGVEGSDPPDTAVRPKLNTLSAEIKTPSSINVEDSSLSVGGNVLRDLCVLGGKQNTHCQGQSRQ